MTELSIIMPLFNNERYVGQAIQSLLSQSYTDFELIIVDDASTDKSLQIVKSFSDSRIRILLNHQNQGIVYSRNKGLEAARGTYIAPFDSDDVAMPEKFRKQIDFLKTHPEYGMIGSWAEQINEEGKILKTKWKLDASPQSIPSILLFRNYFVQSSIVLRRESIPVGGYKLGYDIVEDYIMWADVSRIYITGNFPEYLVQYRIHSQSSTAFDDERLKRCEAKVFQHIYSQLDIEINDLEARILQTIKSKKNIINLKELAEVEDFLLLLLSQNKKLQLYDERELEKVVFNRWIKSCYKARFQNIGILRVLMGSSLSKLFLVGI